MKHKNILVLVVLGFFLGFIISNISFADKAKSKDSNNLYKELELFSDTLSVIRKDYVEEPDAKEIIYGALQGMLSSLDPYSQFMDPEMYNEMKIDTEGEFGGIGIEITMRDHLLTIISPIDGTPAYKVGLKPGDKIVKIDGDITRDLSLMDAVKKLRGKPGTDVKITVLRESENKLLDFKITRSIIKIESIRKAEVIDGIIGYIRLIEFQEKTSQDLEKALRELEKENIKGLVLDLRNNPGGLLDSAVGVSAKFLEKDKLIVSTKGRVKTQNMVFKSKDTSKHLEYPMVVLINGGSASASEIVAGAIQDHKRGIIMGTESFGKGCVQTVIPLTDGSAIRLTTSKYFTPLDRSIHGKGITPDIIVEYKDMPKGEDDDTPDIFDELIKNKDKKEDKAKKIAKKVRKEKIKKYDNQILSAVDVLKGIIVYNKK